MDRISSQAFDGHRKTGVGVVRDTDEDLDPVGIIEKRSPANTRCDFRKAFAADTQDYVVHGSGGGRLRGDGLIHRDPIDSFELVNGEQ